MRAGDVKAKGENLNQAHVMPFICPNGIITYLRQLSRLLAVAGIFDEGAGA
jgi:hypothetical protein